MSHFILKHYFLTEIERMGIEAAILKCNTEQEDTIFSLDDYEITELYNEYIKEALVVY